ncbi:hypothetical protein O0L34_g5955 [Tuta absoluta]|nr:hypothetical protein O0L34_g5955 [Tuta absoluta]
MCAEKVAKGCKMVKPILSMNKSEAHSRVLGLYRAYYRYIPRIVRYHDIPKSEEEVRLKIRELFYKNASVEDVRVIDTLILKGYMELREITHQWQQKGHVFANWCPTLEPKRKDFIGKFLESND